MARSFLIIMVVIGLAIAGFYIYKELPRKGIALKPDLIIVSAPRIGDTITNPLLIIGKARGPWFFEATFPVVLTDWDGRIIAEHYAQALGDWMTNDFVPFETVLEFKNPALPGTDENHFSRRGYLILQKSNPSGLPKHDDALEIPIKF